MGVCEQTDAPKRRIGRFLMVTLLAAAGRSVALSLKNFRSQSLQTLQNIEIPATQVAQMLAKIITFVVMLFLPVLAIANGSVPNDHSTVNIIFVVPYKIPVFEGMGGGGMGGGQAGGGGMFAVEDDVTKTKVTPSASVGGLALLPVDEINPISISIDGEFVGHSMTGGVNIKPVFVLPSGLHKFEFSSDEYETKKVELRVIGTGSTQYLIVKLLPPSSKNTENSSQQGLENTPAVP